MNTPKMIRRWIVAMSTGVCLLFAAVDLSHAGAVSKFDDILFWVGEDDCPLPGDCHQAALLVDWDGNAADDHSMVWGFRWKGSASGYDMLATVLAADSRLYARTNGSASAGEVYGIGYDANGDGAFQISDDSSFDTHGMATGVPGFDPVIPDQGDYYEEGWWSSYWHHAVASSDDAFPTGWMQGSGISTELQNGDWHGLSYDTDTIVNLLVPSLPIAAESIALVGDYGRDGVVDAADFTLWRDTVGQSPFLPGYGADGDGNGLIEMNDYEWWTDAVLKEPLAQVLVPEPMLPGMFAWIALLITLELRKKVR